MVSWCLLLRKQRKSNANGLSKSGSGQSAAGARGGSRYLVRVKRGELAMSDILPTPTAGSTERASRFIGEPTQEPSTSRHGMSHRLAVPDSGNAVLHNHVDYSTGYICLLSQPCCRECGASRRAS